MTDLFVFEAASFYFFEMVVLLFLNASLDAFIFFSAECGFM